VKLKKQQQELNAAIEALETELNNDPANAAFYLKTGTKSGSKCHCNLNHLHITLKYKGNLMAKRM
jgi:hypothetical protein